MAMAMVLTKAEALQRIEEAAVLDNEIKVRKARLDVLKDDLADWWLEGGKKEGKKFTTGISEAMFVEANAYDPINISTLFDKLKSYGKQGELFGVVKADLTALKKVLGEQDIKELQGEPTAVKVSLRLKLKV